MLRYRMDSLFNRSVVKAHQVCQPDGEVDEQQDQLHWELSLCVIKDPQAIQRATYLLWVSHDPE